MTVLETGDATEVESVLDVAHCGDGPVYVRFLRGVVPRSFPQGEPMVLGRARVLHEGDDPTVLDALRRARHGVVTLENHTIVGGLGSAVAELMAEHAVGKPLLRLGLRDTYAHGARQAFLMRAYGLDAMALVRGVERRRRAAATSICSPRRAGAAGGEPPRVPRQLRRLGGAGDLSRATC